MQRVPHVQRLSLKLDSTGTYRRCHVSMTVWRTNCRTASFSFRRPNPSARQALQTHSTASEHCSYRTYALMTSPRTQQFPTTYTRPHAQRLRKTFSPLNSRRNACASQSACVPAHTARSTAARCVLKPCERRGTSSGKKTRYHKKYCQWCQCVRIEGDDKGAEHTWDVQTLLNTTNANVCTNHANGKSTVRLPNANPEPRASTICGMKLTSGERKSPWMLVGSGVSGTSKNPREARYFGLAG